MIGPPRTTNRPGNPQAQAEADATAAGVLQAIVESMARHPRSQQKLIGPSEIGIPCRRALLYKLAQAEEPDRGPAFKPWVGTQCHAGLETVFEQPRLKAEGFVTEANLHVGDIGPYPIRGSCDLWAPGGVVIDWKFVGSKRLDRYREKGPGPQYRTQAHTYGRGWHLLGREVRLVMIVFLPRDGELDDGYWWWEPWDEAIALAGLDRANHLYALLESLGLEKAVALFDPCHDQYCPWCSTVRSAGTASTMFQPRK